MTRSARSGECYSRGNWAKINLREDTSKLSLKRLSVQRMEIQKQKKEKKIKEAFEITSIRRISDAATKYVKNIEETVSTKLLPLVIVPYPFSAPSNKRARV